MGDNLPFFEGRKRDQLALELGTLQSRETRNLLVASRCRFPVSLTITGATTYEYDIASGIHDGLYLSSQRRNSYRGIQVVSLASRNVVRRAQFFQVVPDREQSSLYIVTVDQDGLALDVCFTHTGFGSSPFAAPERAVVALHACGNLPEVRDLRAIRFFVHDPIASNGWKDHFSEFQVKESTRELQFADDFAAVLSTSWASELKDLDEVVFALRRAYNNK